MNRHAAVLAADSATTVSQWNGAQREVRYFKGANKILPLSNHAPIGLMTFAGADILDVPWEVVIKEFRKALGNRTFNYLKEYAEEFFSFLENESGLFPLEIQKSTLLMAAQRFSYWISIGVPELCGEGSTPVDWSAKFDTEIVRLRSLIDEKPLCYRMSDDWVIKNILVWAPELAAMTNAYLNIPEREARPTEFGALSELALWTVLKSSEEYLGMTGLVIAGYGEKEVFPSYVQYSSAGLVGGRALISETAYKSIDRQNLADLSAFAQTGMIDTFQLGLDTSVFIDANLSFEASARELVDKIAGIPGVDISQAVHIPALITEAREKFRSDWLEKTRNKHAEPLRRVLAALPISEMAELAETLVNLQSLKEKVTKPSEEVGGPIDVAVITKAEGLVWIRRKHFFDPSLNARYMARLRGIFL